MLFDESGIIGKINIKKYEKEILIAEYNYKNLITNKGLDYLLKMIGGDISGGISRLGLGGGTIPATFLDTQLNNRLILVNVIKDYSEVGKINFLVNIPENSFTETVGYREAGLYYKSTTEEILITRVNFDNVVYQNPQNSLSISYSLELKRGV